jgi:ABC-type transport system involved in multi-copper enzyme maturation permease subunit
MTGFRWLLHAEFTKFRTVRGWVVGLALAAAVLIGFGILPGRQGSCNRPESACVLPVGPGGQEVTDTFTYVHQALAGDGSLTVRVASLTGAAQPGQEGERAILAPWAKAGLIIKDGTKPGSTYAAVLLTGSKGVRMQYDYTHDRAGVSGSAAPRWLRLTRSGETITGAESADGTAWTTVGTARLPGLPATAQAGLFVTSPQYAEQVGVAGAMGGPTRATAAFDHVARQGAWAAPAWITDNVGASRDARAEQRGDVFTLTGSGDIAPAVSGAAGIGVSIAETLLGTFVALLFMVVIGAMFVAGEYRRGLIRTTLAAAPGRGRVLAAKAVVLGAVTFVTGLAAAGVVIVAGQRVLRANGVYVHPASALTELRVVVGTAALLALAAVFALALGVLLRRGTIAVTTAVVLVVLPYLFAMTVLPAGAAQWLLRVSPAAAFALQQSTPEYAQVANLYTPPNGYFPLPPWGGFAVLAAWAAVALAAAAYLLRRRDA